MKYLLQDMVQAVQFLTRLPISWKALDASRLHRAAMWFPLAGLVVALPAAGLHLLLVNHLSRVCTAILCVFMMMLMTGGLHEDGFADCADAFGGGWTREARLRIMKDSRIGTFGALALLFSVGMRVALLASMPMSRVIPYLMVAQILSRWTCLPLSAMLVPARGNEGQGSRVAASMSWSTVVFGGLIALALSAPWLHWTLIAPAIAVVLLIAPAAWYFHKRIGGVTGDCLGATIQLAEIAVLCCGAWVV